MRLELATLALIQVLATTGCPEPEPDPCAEVDLQTASDNCGTCGHDCLGGACQAGECRPFALASNQNSPRRLVVDEDWVYFTIGPSGQGTESGSVRRVARAGGEVATLADRLFIPVGLAVAAGTVYFANGDCTVAALPADGGEPEVLAEQDCANELTTSGGYLYWTGSTPGQSWGHVSRVRLDGSGGAQPIVPENELSPGGVAVADGAVYWVNAPYNYPEGGEVRMAPVGGGEPVSLASMQNQPADVTVAGGLLFWTNSAFTGGGVMSLALPDGSATVVAPAMGSLGLAADDATLYVAVHGENLLLAVPLDGAEARVLATDQLGIDDVAVDDTAIYWVNDNDDGAVMMLAK